LVIVCFLLVLNSTAELEKLRIQNKQLSDQMTKFRNDYDNLLKSFQPSSSEQSSPEPEKEATGSLTEREKIQIVKNNAYKIQNITEGYAYDHGGFYPADLKALDTYATSTYMNEVVNNPYNNKQAYVTDPSICIDISVLPADEGIAENAGKLLFQANPNEDNKITTYTIAALDGEGFLIKDEGDNIFTLSNAPSG